MKTKKSIAILSLGVPVLLVSLYSVFFTVDTEESLVDNKTVDTFEVVHPAVIDTAFSRDYIATLHAARHVEIRSRIRGFLEAIHVDEGQKVQKGQLLFSISKSEYETELLKATSASNSAMAELKAAEVEWQSTKELVDKNIESVTQLNLAQAKIDALKAKVDEARSHEKSAKLQVSYAEIRAPFNGTIGRIPNKVGSLEEEGALLTTISDNSTIYAYFNVSEREYLQIFDKEQKSNDQVNLIQADQKVYPQPGAIETLDNAVDHATGTITFRASFPNPTGRLIHGATGKVRINTLLENALVIPQAATMEAQDIMYVFAVNDNNIIERKKITPAYRLPRLYVINEGLSKNDKIIFKGLQHVYDGLKVETEVVNFLQSAHKNDENLAFSKN
ncbi:efflux RND transporter periplasmic adaptor subunit [Fulvivirga imtechensis]|nr:efflux RND transporter periplasmic adaptor subunit [Fulvivirga imtechensis]